jgi:hypothetical protein
MEPSVRGCDVDPNAVGSAGRHRAAPSDADTDTARRVARRVAPTRARPDYRRNTNPMGGHPANPRY